MIEDTSRLVNPLNLEEDINKHSDPFSNPRIDNYCSEREAKVYLTREDIKELGFLRSNPERRVYRHAGKPTLYLMEIYDRDYGVKDAIVRAVIVYSSKMLDTEGQYIRLYNSVKPNKQDIQQVIDNYAG